MTKLSKEEFLEKLKVDKDFCSKYGRRDITNGKQILPPCHYGFQLYTRELTYQERYNYWFDNNYETGFERHSKTKVDFDNPYWTPTPERAISLKWSQRSVDTALGLPFNLASYALLLMIIAKKVNMIPEEVIGSLGDTHIYKNQIDGIQEQLTRNSFDLPTVTISDKEVDDISEYTLEDFTLENYQSHPAIKMPLSN